VDYRWGGGRKLAAAPWFSSFTINGQIINAKITHCCGVDYSGEILVSELFEQYVMQVAKAVETAHSHLRRWLTDIRGAETGYFASMRGKIFRDRNTSFSGAYVAKKSHAIEIFSRSAGRDHYRWMGHHC